MLYVRIALVAVIIRKFYYKLPMKWEKTEDRFLAYLRRNREETILQRAHNPIASDICFDLKRRKPESRVTKHKKMR